MRALGAKHACIHNCSNSFWFLVLQNHPHVMRPGGKVPFFCEREQFVSFGRNLSGFHINNTTQLPTSAAEPSPCDKGLVARWQDRVKKPAGLKCVPKVPCGSARLEPCCTEEPACDDGYECVDGKCGGCGYKGVVPCDGTLHSSTSHQTK